MSEVDPRRFPRLSAYLNGLPAGFESYPEATAKASMFRDALQDKPMREIASSLPAPLADLILYPPLVSTWVRSVLMQSIFLVMADHLQMSDEAFAAWTHRTQKALLGGPLYRAMVALASPTMLLNGASVRWRSFHRGSDVNVTQTAPREALLVLSFPRGLYALTNIVGFGGGFQAVAELSNAKPVSVSLLDTSQTRARYQFRWR